MYDYSVVSSVSEKVREERCALGASTGGGGMR